MLRTEFHYYRQPSEITSKPSGEDIIAIYKTTANVTSSVEVDNNNYNLGIFIMLNFTNTKSFLITSI